MLRFAIPVLACALAVSAQAAGPAPPAARTAALSFVSQSHLLVGTAYGLDAIDARPRVYGQRLTAELLPGERTVAYTCPGAAPVSGSSQLIFNFQAGQRYELVCQAGRAAVIRISEQC